MFLLLACVDPLAEADDVCAGEFSTGVASTDSRTAGIQVLDDAGEASIHVDLRWPEHFPAADERWPVVVVLHGGWNQEGTPLDDDSARPEVGEGLVALHMDFPGNGRSGGENDRRGAGTRAAVAAVMRYAAGGVLDAGGCSIQDRVRRAELDTLYLMGLSNGGNLAAAVLADEGLELPEVSGLVTWETPVGPVFANVELGGEVTVYDPGSCSLDLEAGVSCAFPADQLARGGSDLCFDQDGDDSCTGADIVIKGTEDPISGLRMLSPGLRQAAEDRGLSLPAYADVATTDAWWRERDATRQVEAMFARWPSLPVLLVASEEDHVLPWSDHPHIYAWGEALQAAGAPWTRLNPGDEWLVDNAYPNDPDMPLALAAPGGHLLTEEEEDPLEMALAAAVRELHHRVTDGDW